MKNVTLHISEDFRGDAANGANGSKPISISFGRANYDATVLTVGVNKPMGYTMSSLAAAEVNNLIGDAYAHITGTSSFDVTKVESTIADMLTKLEDVNEVILYKED